MTHHHDHLSVSETDDVIERGGRGRRGGRGGRQPHSGQTKGIGRELDELMRRGEDKTEDLHHKVIVITMFMINNVCDDADVSI